jgi:CPA2 family monovalent cation:H+ antiporter-2
MGGDHFILNVGVALLAALAGGLAARVARLPLLVGYLLAGVAIGPHTPGFFVNEEAVHSVARLGVALLMFAVGVQFHLRDLFALRRIALLGGGVQILATILLGWLVARALGWGHFGGVFLGCALALSSTAVMMHILEERGELGTGHGAAMLAILVMQDLSVILMATLLPAMATLGTQGAEAFLGLGASILQAVVLVALTLLLAVRVVPALLDRVARMGSHELFLLVIVCICLTAAYLSRLAGLSMEIGAFLAGLVISESDYAHEAFSQVRPLRDVFASLFFVSVGMLLDPSFLVDYWPAVLAVVTAILVGKGAIVTLVMYALGAHGRTSLLTGLGLAQIGEFSFVLASIGSARGLIQPRISGVILTAALITILLAPFVFGSAGPLYARLNRFRAVSRWFNRQRREVPLRAGERPRGARVLILGCGRVGRHVSDALRAKGVPQVVVDYNASVVSRLRDLGVPVVYGDATSEVVLARVHPKRVELAVVALPEASMTLMAVTLLKRLRPNLPVVVRVHRGVDIPRVRKAGADAIFHAEFEAATGVIRHVLGHLHCPHEEIDTYIEEIRKFRYRHEEETPSAPEDRKTE